MQTLGFGLTALQTPEGLEITGRTYDSRDKLKALGGKWNAEKKAWILPPDADLSSLQPPPPAPRTAPLPRMQKVFRTWVCGKKVAKINPGNPQGPMIWVCSCCPTYKSDYDGT